MIINDKANGISQVEIFLQINALDLIMTADTDIN